MDGIAESRACGDVNTISLQKGQIRTADEFTHPHLRALDNNALVTGTTAHYLDLQHSLGEHLPVALTLAVLFTMTGSLILPLKQLLMNALGLSAMLGILVRIFQDGRPMAAFDVAESATSATSATSGRKPAPNAGSRLSGVRHSPPPHDPAGRHMAEAAADSELRPF